MKRFFFYLSMTILVSFLFSCASVSEEPATSSMDTPKAETAPVTVWRPSTEVFAYTDGNVDRTLTYEYDEAGRLKKTTEFDGRGETVEIREYSYNGSHQIGRQIFNDQGLVSRTEFVVDDQGHTIKEVSRDAEDRILSTVSYRYFGGHIAESVASDASGVPQLKSTYVYKDDELASVEYASPGGSVEARFVRTFDDDRVVEETTFLSDGTIEKRRELLYEGGSLIGEVFYSGNSRSKSVEYERDGDGNIVVEKWFSSRGREYEIVDRTWVSFEIDG